MRRTDDILDALYAERAELLAQLDRVEQALAAVRALEEPAGPPRLGAKVAILAALRQLGENGSSVADVYEHAVSLGWTSTSTRPRNLVASTLSKLARAGVIERISEDSYRLADFEYEVAVA